ncbi:MAG: Response regulator receiver sensor signal transduction histidine kinase, partial [uncultured bacterium]
CFMNNSKTDKVNIVVIDNLLSNAELVSIILRSCGYSVKPFTLAAEALDYLEGTKDKISLVIADLMLAGISGHDLCRRLRANPKYKFTPFLVSSCLGDVEDRVSAMEAGADDFINKPIDRDTLITRAKSLVRTQALYDELIDKNEKLEFAFKKLQEAQNALISNEKFVTIGAMAQGLTHEIFNPLTIIGGNLERLNMRIKSDRLDAEFLSQIITSTRNAVKRCTKIVEALETYSAEKINSIETANINDILKSVCTLFAVKLKMMYSIDITENYDESIGEVECDPRALQQAFMNLMTNAAESIGKDGSILISTELTGGGITVTIADTGKGFGGADMSKAFDPFYSTKNRSLSSGLGLAVVSGVVKMHKSSIDIGNGPSGGARVVVTIPADLKLDANSSIDNFLKIDR